MFSVNNNNNNNNLNKFCLDDKGKIAHASCKYRKVKCILGNVIFWYIFVDVLFHWFLEHF